jgi:CheY-like chemotaxis protein
MSRVGMMILMDDRQEDASPIVLVADDDPVMRLLAREALEPVGLTMLEAVDGVEAMEMCRHMRPALVLLDLLMPQKWTDSQSAPHYGAWRVESERRYS